MRLVVQITGDADGGPWHTVFIHHDDGGNEIDSAFGTLSARDPLPSLDDRTDPRDTRAIGEEAARVDSADRHRRQAPGDLGERSVARHLRSRARCAAGRVTRCCLGTARQRALPAVLPHVDGRSGNGEVAVRTHVAAHLASGEPPGRHRCDRRSRRTCRAGGPASSVGRPCARLVHRRAPPTHARRVHRGVQADQAAHSARPRTRGRGERERFAHSTHQGDRSADLAVRP